MKRSPTLFARLYRLSLLVYPREFRSDCAAEMVETLRVRDAEESKSRRRLGMLRFRVRELRAVIRTGLRLRFRNRLPLPPAERPDRRGSRGPGDALAQDVRLAWRGWRKSPLVMSVAVTTLALGIGATTSIFSVIDGVLLRGLPYDEPDRLVRIINTLPEADIWFSAMSPEELAAWRRQGPPFERIEGLDAADFVVTGADEPQRIAGAWATVGLMDLLGVRPQIGRGFRSDDAEAASNRVAVISDGMWRRRFGASPSVVGEHIAINHQPYTIVGVMPRGFYLPSQRTQLWLPLPAAPLPQGQPQISLDALARIPAGMDLMQAQALAEAAAEELKKEGSRRASWGIQLRAKDDDRASTETKKSLYVLSGAVGFLLLISCANIANLALARATTRRRELALRAALGASRLQIVRQVLVESVVLGLLGGTLGVVLAFWLLGAITRLAPPDLAVLRESAIGIDLRVLAFATTTSLLTGTVSGLVPAIRGSRPEGDPVLARATRAIDGTRSRLRGALVAAEVGLSLVLLIGAGLMVGSFARLRGVDPGFDTGNLLAVDLALDEGRYPTGAQRQAFFEELADMIRALPGVESVTVAIGTPPEGGVVEVGPSPEAEGRPSDGAGPIFLARTTASSSYFRTLRIPLLDGRTFVADDAGEEHPMVVVNATLARRLWGDESAVGRRFRLDRDNEDEPWLTVLGVVDDVDLKEIGEYGELQIYYPLTAVDDGLVDRRVVVRAAGDPLDLAPAIKARIRALDAGLPIDGIGAMEERFDQLLATPRFYVWLMGGFAVAAGALAAVGIYGVTAYTVGQRTHEIGIRVALGARRGDVLSLVLRSGMAHVLWGMILGLAGAVALSRTLAGMLYEVPATDPATYAAVCALLAAIALIACYIPARRTTRADPLEALRSP